MRGEAMLAGLAAALIVAAAIWLPLQWLAPSAAAPVFGDGAAVSLDTLAAATRL